MKAVLTENLTKIYPGGNKAVNNISFSLNQGEIFGFLGPNGSGKTTTIKLLCGMLTPTTGACRVFNLDPAKDTEQLHQLAGVMTEHAQMYDHLSGMDNLMFYGQLFGISTSNCKKKAADILERLNLTDAQNRKLSAYSTGMRQRLSLGRAMLHNPKILFLDEPTSGLDPESAQNVNALISELAANGTTIFLCTHQLRYAQEICTAYGLMNRGNLFATGTLDALRTNVSSQIKVRIQANHLPEELSCHQIDPHTYEMIIQSEREIPEIARKIILSGSDLYHISADQLSLEEIYFSLIGQNHSEMEGEHV